MTSSILSSPTGVDDVNDLFKLMGMKKFSILDSPDVSDPAPDLGKPLLGSDEPALRVTLTIESVANGERVRLRIDVAAA